MVVCMLFDGCVLIELANDDVSTCTCVLDSPEGLSGLSIAEAKSLTNQNHPIARITKPTSVPTIITGESTFNCVDIDIFRDLLHCVAFTAGLQCLQTWTHGNCSSKRHTCQVDQGQVPKIEA